LISKGSDLLFDYPKGFPQIEFPEGNEYTEERWELGKMLFYDKALSVDGSISCAHCHKAELAFADHQAKTDGVFKRAGVRNAPSLANIGYHPYFTREGGIPSLEMQILVPIQEHNEFGHNIIDIVEDLSKDSSYQQRSRSAYGRSFDAYVLTRALATFERSLISGNSPYDNYINNGDVFAMNAEAMAGMDLFFSERTNCSSCHSGFNFSNYAFENNGLYEEYEDLGRMRLTSLVSDKAKFKVPSLRNVELTAPYMHDGSLASLEAVVEHYNKGGHEHINKSKLIKPLSLSDKEKGQLVAFLKSLSDQRFIKNEKFKN
jgi:cytochrome c peroxidase